LPLNEALAIQEESAMADEKKTLLEIILMPLVVAVIGATSTFAITSVQIANSERQFQAQLQSAEKIADGNLKVKALEIFRENIFEDDLQKRKMAVGMLTALDRELGLQISKVIAENKDESPEIQKLASETAKFIEGEIQREKREVCTKLGPFKMSCKTVYVDRPISNKQLNPDAPKAGAG
jgi:hypothetical protein